MHAECMGVHLFNIYNCFGTEKLTRFILVEPESKIHVVKEKAHTEQEMIPRKAVLGNSRD